MPVFITRGGAAACSSLQGLVGDEAALEAKAGMPAVEREG
jgi:hypothetical protein